ncbi:MAG: hypothetical protein DDT26_02503 [Dehalococcoidia bacterium]|nr:hypothetical protein [Chloroflexota bacterium]
MMQHHRREATAWHFAPTGQPRRSASTEPAENLARSQKSPKPKMPYLQRLTLELSGHINREAIDWSA